MNSALFVGSIRHRRFTPVSHNFSYPMFMPWIDLDELDVLQQQVTGFGTGLLNVARFRGADYLRDHHLRDHHEKPGLGTLKQQVIDKVFELTGERMQGRVMLLCQLRYAGLYFSPLNLYYLYDARDQWQWVLAEVSNTPWNERHYYAIPAKSTWMDKTWQHEKAFHVSPFNPITQRYQWQLKAPDEHLFVHIDILSEHSLQKVLDATMAMKRQPFNTRTLWRLLASTPIQTVKVVAGIYWQALRLWLKRVPFYSHATRNKTERTNRKAARRSS
ncbi:DUF1365 domain-containing protein [Photobacterium atrarenae]|uniref:DUF1365 domain-containing protein n=1 Tax=Photobacterium atrarenae TaxID=865757 RepID=A0ABY5GMZ1_9GAMM|nr:DUF1365 domain-containing protein [Photobacterium atrarenae]UTV30069.1 DUF1365 domain-containing protein [Photobacterium atrarenae]